MIQLVKYDECISTPFNLNQVPIQGNLQIFSVFFNDGTFATNTVYKYLLNSQPYYRKY